MRKILFRGKSKEAKEWIYGLPMHTIEAMPDRGEYMGDIIDYWYIDDLLNGLSEIDPSTIGQYWRTINDIQLFEGDIFTVKHPELTTTVLKVIRYNEKKACFCIANISNLKDEQWMDIWEAPNPSWWADFGPYIEILGNVFDNPELLK